MNSSVDKIKIEMTLDEAQKLKEQISKMIFDITTSNQQFATYFDEPFLIQNFPQVNELLNVLNVRDELPF